MADVINNLDIISIHSPRMGRDPFYEYILLDSY